MRNQEHAIRYVSHLPDLLTWEDVEAADRRKVIRVCLAADRDGLEILGDSAYPAELEKLLAALGPEAIEMMLCG